MCRLNVCSRVTMKIATIMLLVLSACTTEKEIINLVPNEPAADVPNYYCTWQYQLWFQEPPVTTRDVVCHDILFGDNGLAKTIYPELRKDLYFVLDDGWDLPYDGGKMSPGPYFGGLVISETKFPGYGDTPQERLKTMVKNIEDCGWKGTGIWICAQEDEQNRGETWKEEYWRERIEWSKYAGIKYWKVDWGIYCDKQEWRQMITRLADEIYPDLIIEHAFCCPPINDWKGTGLNRCTPEFIETCMYTASYSDVFRNYDITEELSVATSLDRIGEFLLAAHTDGKHLGFMNSEDEVYMGASMGLTMGVMRYPLKGKEQNSPFLATRPIRKMLDEVTRAVRWQRIAPAYRTDAYDVQVSDEYLTDDYVFGPYWTKDVENKHIKQMAPAVIARGISLPEVSVESGEKPFVLAARNPNGAISIATFGRTNASTKYKAIEAKITLNAGDLTGKIGVFGYYDELKLSFNQSLEGKTVLAQDLKDNKAIDITSDVMIKGNDIVICGSLIKKIGRMKATDGDLSEPGLVLQIGESKDFLPAPLIKES